MYADLNIPFVYTENEPLGKKKDRKGKGAGGAGASAINRDDAALQWSGIDASERKSLETRTRTLIHLGYGVVAYEHYVKNFSPQLHSNPFPATHPVFPELDTRSTAQPRSILQLRRLTIELDEGNDVAKQINQSAVSVLNNYDILAVKVVGANSFNNACLNMCAPSPFAVHVIQIDLAANTRLPFYLKRTTTGKAISDGAFFEICYGGALDGNDEYGRRNLIAGVKEILRVTNGRGVIFSSSVKNALHLRSPGDVINLGTVFGMNQAVAKKALVDNPKTVVNNSESRRLFKGIFSEPIIHQALPPKRTGEASTANANKKQKQNKKSKV